MILFCHIINYPSAMNLVNYTFLLINFLYHFPVLKVYIYKYLGYPFIHLLLGQSIQKVLRYELNLLTSPFLPHYLQSLLIIY